MTFVDAINKGRVVRVQNDGAINIEYDPGEFWLAKVMQDGQPYNMLMCWGPELGCFECIKTEEELEEHFENMIDEGFQIVIKNQNWETKMRTAEYMEWKEERRRTA